MASEWAAKLMSPDSIMEPGVTDAMKGYLEEGGEPETAIQMLADSYRGFAEMASLVGDWLHTAGVPHDDVVATVSRAVGDAVFQAFDPRLADSLFQKAAVCVVAVLWRLFSSRITCSCCCCCCCGRTHRRGWNRWCSSLSGAS